MYSRIRYGIERLKAELPAKRVQKTRVFRFDLLSDSEQVRCHTFFDSLPFDIIKDEWDFTLLSNAQLDVLGNWIRLEDALRREDVVKAEEMRKHLDTMPTRKD